jgi:putative ABC transport system permease protein
MMNTTIMIKHIIKLGFRNLSKDVSTTLVHIFSLSLGIAILLVISLFVKNELSVDQFHDNSSRIFKTSYGKSSGTPGPLSELLSNNFPEIQHATHIETRQLFAFSPLISYSNKPFEIEKYYSVDSSFFRVFDFQVLQGDIENALTAPFSMILTESEASRIFKNKNPIGETIIWRTTQDFIFTVQAIVKDIPQNSSLQFKGLISEASTKIMSSYYPDNWGFGVYETYLLLNSNVNPEQLEKKLRAFLIEFYEKNLSSYNCREDARTTPLELHGLREVYFNETLSEDSTNRGNIVLIRILIAVGSIIMLLSIINYVNLSTARASLRKKEIGVQKVCGSNKRTLVLQYLTETTIISSFSAILGILITVLILPAFSQFMSFSQNLKFSPVYLVVLVPGILILGFIAGIYPAFKLSSQKAIHILQKNAGKHGKGKNLRFSLVVFQLVVSMTLIAITFLINDQVTFLKTKDSGIKKEHVIYAKLPPQLMRGGKDIFTERLRQVPDIEKVAYASKVLGEMGGANTLEFEGKTMIFTSIWVDAEFIDLYDLQLVKGRFFSEEIKSDINATALLNEAALRELDIKDPFEIEIRVPGGNAKVVGIVKDFNYKSLHHSIEPLAIIYLPGQGAYANIKLSGTNIQQSLDGIGEIWNELAPGHPFTYHFLDASFDKLYKSDAQMGQAISCSSLIAIIIAVLGVLSLSLFLCESRVKEIGIRKINGAKVWEVILGLNKGLLINLLIAFSLACPLAWFIMRHWLDNFAYKTSISPWIFIASGGIVSTIAFTIVSWQSWRFANLNPADTLRNE